MSRVDLVECSLCGHLEAVLHELKGSWIMWLLLVRREVDKDWLSKILVLRQQCIRKLFDASMSIYYATLDTEAFVM